MQPAFSLLSGSSRSGATRCSNGATPLDARQFRTLSLLFNCTCGQDDCGRDVIRGHHESPKQASKIRQAAVTAPDLAHAKAALSCGETQFHVVEAECDPKRG